MIEMLTPFEKKLVDVVLLQKKAINELMREYMTKKDGAVNWSIVNDAAMEAKRVIHEAGVKGR